MTVKERILALRLLDKIERHPEYNASLCVSASLRRVDCNKNKGASTQILNKEKFKCSSVNPTSKLS